MIVRIISRYQSLKGFSKYTWAKYVQYFDDTRHCAPCLQGRMARGIHGFMRTNQDIHISLEERQPFYICGVAYPWNWANNMHLAVIGKIGAEASLQLYTGDTLLVKDAEQYVFDDRAAREKYPNLGREFLTCRNFQFGAQYFSDKGNERLMNPKMDVSDLAIQAGLF